MTNSEANILRRLYPIVIGLMCLLPAAAWLEETFRAETSRLVFRHFILEWLTTLFLIVPIVALLYWYLAVVSVLLLTVYFLLRRGVRDWRDRRLEPFKLRIWSALNLVVGFGLSAFWWLLAGWRPTIAAIAGVLLFLVFLTIGRKIHRLRFHFWQIVGFIGLTAVILLNLTNYYSASIPATQQLYDEACYDATIRPDGALVALSDPSNRAVVLQNGKREEIVATYGPQRIALDAEHNRVYVANFNAKQNRAVTEIDGLEAHEIDLPRCRKTIDLAIARNKSRLLVACEFSGSLHIIDMPGRRVEMTWRVPRLPYALAVNDRLDQVLVTSELLSGKISLFSLTKENLLAGRSFGAVNWGAVADERRGLFWVARPIVGEVWALDGNLNIKKRIRTGGAPRDLALDEQRGLLYAGNYFSGTVAVIDVTHEELRANMRVGRAGLLRRLRGVELAPDGSLLVSDGSGVWRLPPQ